MTLEKATEIIKRNISIINKYECNPKCPYFKNFRCNLFFKGLMIEIANRNERILRCKPCIIFK